MLEKVALKEVIDHAQKLQTERQFDAAIDILNQVIGQHPDNPFLNYAYASSLMHKSQFGLAIVLLMTAIKSKPDFAEAWNNLAVCYRREYNIELARKAAHKAIELKDKWSDPFNNLAGTCINEGCPEEGLQWSDKALEYQENKDSIEANKIRWNKALMLLELGRFKEGFELYEAGLDCGERNIRNYSEDMATPTPYLKNIKWLKKGKTVAVYGEQGMGDEIMFLSCLQNLVDTGATVILDAHPRMTSLFHRAWPELEIHNTRKRDDLTWPLDRQIDYCVAVGSLPRLYLQNHESFEQRAYLSADADIASKMREELADHRPLIGIAWSGGTKKTNNWYRSLDMKTLEKITKNPNYKFVSLQYDDDGHVPANVDTAWEVTQHFNYDLTAALVEACDAVIAVNTSVVHLAGAMGKRVFTLTPSRPAWRYGVKGTDMIFYSDVHQYRQDGENWGSTINNLLHDLHLWSNLNLHRAGGVR